MSVGDANDVQLVVQYLFRAGDGGRRVSVELAREAALRLADRSRTVLGAGMPGHELQRRQVRR